MYDKYGILTLHSTMQRLKRITALFRFLCHAPLHSTMQRLKLSAPLRVKVAVASLHSTMQRLKLLPRTKIQHRLHLYIPLCKD